MNKQITGSGTVGKALDVLDTVASFGRPVRFSELLADSPHPKATLYRLLQSLTHERLITHDAESGSYSLGLRLVQLAHSAWRQSSLAPIAAPTIEALAKETGETVHLAQIDNGQIIFVDKCRTSNIFETLAQPGRVAPAFCTGVGKAILAFLSADRLDRALTQQAFLQYTPNTHPSPASLMVELAQIAQDGIAFDREEHEQGIISIAAPILDGNDRVIGAVSIVTSTTRKSLDDLSVFRPALLAATARIGAEAHDWQFPAVS
ncbi:IclR family transcriptional regulator [Sulfitobacter sp. S190]|uniref:IclR family transcriptional regulator n=1 Tax=Sulfitobacter sp. S190 TaxID=2867022 RepID=UPI0021A7AAFE|nr:IclR family transcriptional regulator [Sulfitobacter sp. S190]UWR24473.1 IclR family transcriptional regulator [Sulfitobacter sp. S190]UWR24491.1 IclR family transcriptional regulator [Sulfitobacter sp. S190]